MSDPVATVSTIAAILLGIGESIAIGLWGIRGTMLRLNKLTQRFVERVVNGPPEWEDPRPSYIHGLANDISVPIEDLIKAAEREVDGTYDRPKPKPEPEPTFTPPRMNLDGPSAASMITPIILMDMSVSWTVKDANEAKPLTVLTSVTLHGGRADGQRLVLSRTPERLAVGNQWYEQIKDPCTGEFLGGYAHSSFDSECSYCGQPPHLPDGTHFYTST